jgi:7-keto-8-aminopelargonate synthetase-like enzyme
VRIVRAEPWRRDRVRENARLLREGIRGLGCDVAGSPDGHIVPVVIGEAEATMRAGAALRERGFLVGAIRPPTVPLGTSRLRISASAAHTRAEIDGLVAALGDVLRSELELPAAASGAERTLPAHVG